MESLGAGTLEAGPRLADGLSVPRAGWAEVKPVCSLSMLQVSQFLSGFILFSESTELSALILPESTVFFRHSV